MSTTPYPPYPMPKPTVKSGEFPIAAAYLDHSHIMGMCDGLVKAGANIKLVFDPDEKRSETFRETYPDAKVAHSLAEVLNDNEIKLIAGAAIPSKRAGLGMADMLSGKDYFTDKCPFTTLDQLQAAKNLAQKTGKKYMTYFSERLHVEGAVYAGQLIEQGAIGRVLQVIGMGPHRLSNLTRPEWFYKREDYGGILCDIGSHQIEQFLYYAGTDDATVSYARAANLGHPDYPELEDFGEAALTASNGASQYFRVDWFTPDGLRTWGDGRTFILGTEGFIEIRKFIDLTTDEGGDQVLWANGTGEHRFSAAGKVGYPFFGQLILDCLNRTETAMTQAHAFKAAELCLTAQRLSDLAKPS
jgi:predicted dehydrogenase